MRLTFSERPEASLSSVEVLGAGGRAFGIGSAQPVAGDAHALELRVRDLAEGAYTVRWRIVSAVDGHATAGAYAFGVGVSPAAAAATLTESSGPSTTLEVIGRWLLLAGLALVVGAAGAAVGRFGGPRDAALAVAGVLAAAVGLVLLAEAQRRYAAVSVGELLETDVGRALVRRAVLLVVAAIAATVALRRFRREALAVAGAAALGALAVHVAAGHAAAGGWPGGTSVAAQWAHAAAAGVWLGGLVALLLGVRGAPSGRKTVAARRFSVVALGALGLVAVTGTLRALDELGSWRDLYDTGYGRAVVLKAVLVLGLVGFGLLQRTEALPRAGADLGPLRRVGRGELVLAAVAIAVAAVLGAIPPPAAGELLAPPGISLTRAELGLAAASAEPGPNRFTVTGAARADAVELTFDPLDDPGIAPTTLPLAPSGDTWVGEGPNLAFDGRWRVTVTVERGGATTATPFEVSATAPERFVSIERVPGSAPRYDVYLGGNLGVVRFSPDPERPGPSTLTVTFHDVIGDERELEAAVLTATGGDGPTRRLETVRAGGATFVSVLQLEPGPATFAAVARTGDGTRLRAEVELEVPER